MGSIYHQRSKKCGSTTPHSQSLCWSEVLRVCGHLHLYNRVLVPQVLCCNPIADTWPYLLVSSPAVLILLLFLLLFFFFFFLHPHFTGLSIYLTGLSTYGQLGTSQIDPNCHQSASFSLSPKGQNCSELLLACTIMSAYVNPGFIDPERLFNWGTNYISIILSLFEGYPLIINEPIWTMVLGSGVDTTGLRGWPHRLSSSGRMSWEVEPADVPPRKKTRKDLCFMVCCAVFMVCLLYLSSSSSFIFT